MSLHILEGVNSFRFFADHPKARLPFVGNLNLEYNSEKYLSTVKKMQDSGAGVYFSVNKTDGKGAKAENIVAVRSYYVDIDGLSDKTEALERLITARLTPSAIVETKNGVHAYWYAREQGVNFGMYKRVQSGLVKAFQGDKSARDIARVLRVPGTLHLKDPSNPFEVRLVHQLPREEAPVYTGQQILSFYPSPPELRPPVVRPVDSPRSWLALLEDLSSWSPVQGERNNVMLLCAGVAISYGVDQRSFVETMHPIVDKWATGRDVRSELERVARWAYARGNAIPAKVLRSRGVPVRRGL